MKMLPLKTNLCLGGQSLSMPCFFNAKRKQLLSLLARSKETF